MVGSSRLIKIIFVTLGVYLIAINVIMWANSFSVTSAVWADQNNFQQFHNYGYTNYRGFKWFFERISTYPGLNYSYSMFNSYANIVTGYSVTGNWGLDFILAIFRILSAPLLLIVTLSADIIRNAKWFIEFVIFNDGL